MLERSSNTLIIRTPEGISFSLLLAGAVVRCCAWLVDFALLCIVIVFFGRIALAFDLLASGFGSALGLLFFFIASTGYGALFEYYSRGQTPGKRLLRLRVMDSQGLRLQFSQVIVRNLLRPVDLLPIAYLVGGLFSFLNKKYQRLGDIAGNTIVTRIPKIGQPNVEQLLAGKYNSLRDYPHLEARLRQAMTPQESAMMLQAVMRREQLDPEARVKLFSELAAFAKSLVEFPPEASEMITDEQYVRNVVDVLYRSRKADEPKRTRQEFQPV